jgi:glycosyltransferase involved in cell wall biosynthesis
LLIGGDFTHVAGGSVVDRVREAIGDDHRIRLMGFVPEQRIGDFYASLDVFTLPSVNAFEAFGIVQAVAMLAGVPVLSSDIPGVRQPVAQTGFGTVVPPGDAAAITRALRAFQANPPDRAAGAAQAHRAFSVSAVLDGYEVLIDKAAHHLRSTR